MASLADIIRESGVHFLNNCTESAHCSQRIDREGLIDFAVKVIILVMSTDCCLANTIKRQGLAATHMLCILLHSVDAKLAMLVSMSGCPVPKTLFLVSVTCTSSFSTCVHRLWAVRMLGWPCCERVRMYFRRRWGRTKGTCLLSLLREGE